MNTSLYTQRPLTVFLSVCAIGILLTPLFVAAQTVVRVDDSVSVDTDQVVEGDLYSFGSRVRVLGEVTGDWIAAGANVTGSGEFKDDVLVIADTVQINGSTTENVRIVAREVVIAGYVGGNVAVLGGTVEILSSAEIAGDVLMFANNTVITGSVGGDILGRYGVLRIDGPVGGDVDIRVQELLLGSRAEIQGAVTYKSPQELTRAQDAVVEGDVSYREVAVEFSWQDQVQTAVTPVLILVFATLFFFLVQRRRFDAVIEHTLERPFVFSVIGFVLVLTTPLLITLLLVSVLGALIGIVLAGLYVTIVVLGLLLTIPIIGGLLSRWLFSRQETDLLSLGLGAVSVYLLLVIPVFGLPLFLVLLFIGIGGLTTWLYQR